MAVVQGAAVTSPPIICQSSDTKPGAASVGQRLYETDTSIWYVWNGSAWVIFFGA